MLLRNTRRRLKSHEHRCHEVAQAGPDSFYEGIYRELLEGPRAHLNGLRRLRQRSSRNLRHSLSELRDVASLDPVNPDFVPALASLLQEARPGEARDLEAHCAGKDVVLHLCCKSRLQKAWASCCSFSESRSDVSHIIVVGEMRKGSPRRLDFRWDGAVLTLPVSDAYESLADKAFYAYLVLHLLTSFRLVIKVDDDLHLADLERFNSFCESLHGSDASYVGHVLNARHPQMPQGWHQGKCQRRALHQMGYQIPFPACYADGGFGYVLGPAGVEACARMFLSMRAFFEMNSVQLEDVFVGHAAQSAGLLLKDCLDERPFSPTIPFEQAALPGLKRVR